MPKQEAAAETAAEVDIDSMDDAQFAAFKDGMNKGDAPAEEAVASEEKPPSTEATSDDAGDSAQPQKQVPFNEFHRVNERRKEAERLAELSQKRLAELLESLQPKQAAPTEPEVPDPEKDIFAYTKYLESEIKALKGETALSKEERQAQSAFEQTLHASRADVEAYAREKPDMPQAVNFLVQQVASELQLFRVPPHEVEREIQRREYELVQWAAQTGQRPAEFIYNYAMSRGYRPGPAPAQGDQVQQVRSEIEKIVRTEETKQKAKSLGGSGAPTGGLGIGPKDIVEMSEEDFAAFKKKYGDNALARAFGMH